MLWHWSSKGEEKKDPKRGNEKEKKTMHLSLANYNLPPKDATNKAKIWATVWENMLGVILILMDSALVYKTKT